ncbi:MAG: ABC transporter ATP-binding protein [Clostridiales bacterium]|nr:ABC transporter ATP-binding protein [Clostridiales bacterium]
MLQINKINKYFRSTYAVNDVTLSLDDGKVYGLVGLNGAGKSTLMKVICNLMAPDSGEILWNDRPISEARKEGLKIGFMIESPAFFRNLTGYQNLSVLAELFDNVTKEDINRVLDVVGLTTAANKAYKAYSLGMKQRLYFAYALLNSPSLLILDEPFNGIDPLTNMLFKNIVKDTAAKGCCTLISSHSIADIQAVCDEVIIMHMGYIVDCITDPKGKNLEDILLNRLKDFENV